jgi:23S rRNA pseudouridine1911/1915/1917 synthase
MGAVPPSRAPCYHATMSRLEPFTISADQAGQTLAAALRARLPGQSWKQVRALIASRLVTVRDELCLDDARRLREGDVVALLARPAPLPKQPEQIVIRHLDSSVVVVEKPAGVATVRHPTEREWTQRRKELSPTLEDLVPRAIARREGAPQPRLRVVHRLDKGTSGLLVFARTVEAERLLGKQFHAHTVTRRYLALVPGRAHPTRVRTILVRDRGDGRRGSTEVEETGKEAITHVEIAENLPRHTLVRCRLETGRTHQIRIHLAELGHPVCGDKVYCIRRDGTVVPDDSGSPRLFLHAAELGFRHPATRQEVRWEMPLPADLEAILQMLREPGRTIPPTRPRTPFS